MGGPRICLLGWLAGRDRPGGPSQLHADQRVSPDQRLQRARGVVQDRAAGGERGGGGEAPGDRVRGADPAIHRPVLRRPPGRQVDRQGRHRDPDSAAVLEDRVLDGERDVQARSVHPGPAGRAGGGGAAGDDVRGAGGGEGVDGGGDRGTDGFEVQGDRVRCRNFSSTLLRPTP